MPNKTLAVLPFLPENGELRQVDHVLQFQMFNDSAV